MHMIGLGVALLTALPVATGAASASRSAAQEVDPACDSSVHYSIGQSVTFAAANRLGADGPMALATYEASDGAVVVVTTYRCRTSARVAEAVADLERGADVESAMERCHGCAAQGSERRLVIRAHRCGRAESYRIIRADDVAYTVIAAQDVAHALDVECLVFQRP